MAAEAVVQVAPNSTGAKIRNLQVEMYVTDPTTGSPVPQNVLQQVISLADDKGQIITSFVDTNFQDQVIELLTDIRDSLRLLSGKGE